MSPPSAPDQMPHSDPFTPRLRKLLPSYGLATSARLTLLSVSENRTYLAESEGTRLVLRVHRHGYHSENAILSELDWIDALHSTSSVVTARPLARSDGARVSSISVDGQAHAVSAFSFLSGEEPPMDDALVARFGALGALTAQLHMHARMWLRPVGFVRPRWDLAAFFGEDALWGDWRAAYTDTAELAIMQGCEDQIRERLEGYGTPEERFGLIHADLRLANLLDDGHQLAVIDFDDCGFGWFAYDFAAAISFHEHDPRVPALLASWLVGYRTVAPFAEEDEAVLPTLIMARRMILTAWLVSRAGNDTEGQFGAGFADTTLALARAYLDSA